ncbi:MAG: hypothetical protein ACXABY_12235 [Candidatus Thorarchaeota archaeon]|jgi:hypothetical protein
MYEKGWQAIAEDNGFKNEKAMLKHLYYDKMLSLSKIAARFNVTKFTIIYRMSLYNLKRRKVGYGRTYTGKNKVDYAQ